MGTSVRTRQQRRGGVRTYGIPGLDENGARARELAHQAFARGKARDQAARSDAFQDVLGVPSDEMAVVDNVLFAVHELQQTITVSQFGRVKATRMHNGKLTSFRMIAPKLVNHSSPVPEILYTHRPSPLNMALPRPWRL